MRRILIILSITLIDAGIILAGTYSGGSGTSGDPYQIATTSDLIELSNTSGDWDKYFIQTADIAFNADETQVDWDGDGTASWDTEDQEGFSPIGNTTTKFTGIYDGQDYSISNLFIDRATYLGLFGYIGESSGTDKGNVESLNLVNVSINGSSDHLGGLAAYQDISSSVENVDISGAINGSTTSDKVGGLIGEARGTATNCSFDGDVTGDYYIGGLIGDSYGDVSNSFTSGNVNTYDEDAGGFIGRMSSGTVTKSYSHSNMNNFATYVYDAGGFIGRIESGTVSQCYSTGDVSSFRNTAGGFVGINKGEINDCYSRGDVSANESSETTNFGGFVGWNYRGVVINCYSTGAVIYDDNPDPTDKGFAGDVFTGGNYEMTDNFWDTETSEQTTTSGGATGKTTTEMQTQSTFTNWDFTNTWAIESGINDNYPHLKFSLSTWTGANSSDWGTAGNWNPAEIPAEGSHVSIPGSLTNYPLLDDFRTVGDLNIASGASLTIPPQKGLTVDGVLTNSASATGLLIQSDVGSTGSLIVKGAASGDITVKRYVDEVSKAATWHYVSSPVSGQNLNDTWLSDNNIINTPAHQLFRWDEAENYWIIYGSTGNPEAFGDVTFVEARGYTIARDGAGELTFEGTIRTNDVNYPASYTSNKGEGWNLTGNPFTSAIGITSGATTTENFLTENAALLDDSYEALYIWDEQTGYEGSRNDYKVISNAAITGYTQINQNYIQPGQAFMAKVVSPGGNLDYTTGMQAHDDGNFYKSKAVWPSVELRIEGNGQTNTTAIGFHADMTTGLDPSYDVAKLKGNPDLALYSRLVEDNGLDFAIQALPDQYITDFEIALGVDVSTNAEYEFSAMQENLNDYSILLEDRQENTFTDLRLEKYSASISESGIGRFYLHFKDATVIGEMVPQTNIILDYRDQRIRISNPENETGIVRLINIPGQVLHEEKLTGDAKQEVAVNHNTGIYIVRIQTAKTAYYRKILVK